MSTKVIEGPCEDGEDGSRTVVRLAGEADITTRAPAEVLGAETAKKPRLLLVDVSGLTGPAAFPASVVD